MYQRQALRIACLVLAILAAVLVTVFAAYRLLVVKPSLPEPGAERPDEDQNYEFGEGPRLSGDRKEEFYTFLLVGRDTGGGGNTDTLTVSYTHLGAEPGRPSGRPHSGGTARWRGTEQDNNRKEAIPWLR